MQQLVYSIHAKPKKCVLHKETIIQYTWFNVCREIHDYIELNNEWTEDIFSTELIIFMIQYQNFRIKYDYLAHRTIELTFFPRCL